jgi:FemAB family protein
LSAEGRGEEFRNFKIEIPLILPSPHLAGARCLKAIHMNIVRAADASFSGLWKNLFLRDALQYPLLTPLDVEYQKEYARESKFEDFSFLAEENGAALMGVRLAAREFPDGKKELSGYGRPIVFLEAENLEPSQRDGAAGVIREELQNVLLANENVPVMFLEHGSTLSPVGRLLLDRGARASAKFSQILNLTAPEAQLRSQIRKSYKSLINWGAKNLKLRLLNHSNITTEAMEQFRLLHIEVAGRETRSARSWELQLEMVRNNEAFVVLGDLDGALVTAALFVHSPKYCYYGVSASKRELFEKPLGHIVLWTAILEAKKIGCKFFELGEQYFPNHGAPTPKELNISAFKKGFGGETVVRVEIQLNK